MARSKMQTEAEVLAEQATAGFVIGAKVSYEDMANPRQCGRIADVERTRWGTSYVIVWQNGKISQSDCRQRGWRVER